MPGQPPPQPMQGPLQGWKGPWMPGMRLADIATGRATQAGQAAPNLQQPQIVPADVQGATAAAEQQVGQPLPPGVGQQTAYASANRDFLEPTMPSLADALMLSAALGHRTKVAARLREYGVLARAIQVLDG